jgi:glycerol-3-phosphate dehydrogenase
MSEENQEMQDLLQQIEQVLDAAQANDLDTIYDHRAAIVSMYAQAMVEFHFEESQLDWLNDIIGAVETDDIAACRRLLAMEADGEMVFLASQFAAVMAGFFHHDECLTVLQAIGLQALLKSIQQQGKEN